MAYVHGLRSTLFLFALGVVFLGLVAVERAAGEALPSYLFFLATGAALLAVVGDGVHRRLRGDPRTCSPEFDDRTVASGAVVAVALAALGSWSAAAGHPGFTWRPLVLLGVLLLVAMLWKRRER